MRYICSQALAKEKHILQLYATVHDTLSVNAHQPVAQVSPPDQDCFPVTDSLLLFKTIKNPYR